MVSAKEIINANDSTFIIKLEGDRLKRSGEYCLLFQFLKDLHNLEEIQVEDNYGITLNDWKRCDVIYKGDGIIKKAEESIQYEDEEVKPIKNINNISQTEKRSSVNSLSHLKAFVSDKKLSTELENSSSIAIDANEKILFSVVNQKFMWQFGVFKAILSCNDYIYQNNPDSQKTIISKKKGNYSLLI